MHRAESKSERNRAAGLFAADVSGRRISAERQSPAESAADVRARLVSAEREPAAAGPAELSAGAGVFRAAGRSASQKEEIPRGDRRAYHTRRASRRIPRISRLRLAVWERPRADPVPGQSGYARRHRGDPEGADRDRSGPHSHGERRLPLYGRRRGSDAQRRLSRHALRGDPHVILRGCRPVRHHRQVRGHRLHRGHDARKNRGLCDDGR